METLNTVALYLVLGVAVNYIVEKFKELRESWEWLKHWLDKTWEMETACCIIGIAVGVGIKAAIVIGDGPVVTWLTNQGVPIGPFVNISWWGFAINGFIAGFLTTSVFKFLKAIGIKKVDN